ncbi:MAG: M20 family metallopeptidase [Chloroflexota bacterium]
MSWIEDCRAFAAAETLPLLEALIAAPSTNPPGREDLAARLLAEYLERHGVPIEWQETEPGRPNVLGTVIGPASGPTLALCSHLDVVPPGNPDLWSSDPFTPRLKDGRLYGRGACDDKGPLAAMAVATAFWRHQGLTRGSLVLAAVCGEERGGTGAKFLVASGFQADGAIIGEATGLEVQVGHKGRIQVTVRVQGTGGHASQPMAAENPIDRLAQVLERLRPLAAAVGDRRHPLVGAASLTPTQVSSGDTNAATIPSMVTLTLDRRLLPGETHAKAAEEIITTLADLPGVEVDWFQGAYPYLLNEDHPVVQACLKGSEVATDARGRVGGFPATCDQYILGQAGIPTAILGPGDVVRNRLHAPDEFVEMSEVETAVLAYAAAARAFLEA